MTTYSKAIKVLMS